MSPDGWQRVAADLLRTTGRRLTISARPFSRTETEFVLLVDGRWCGTSAYPNSPAETHEHDVAEWADQLREGLLDEEIWGGWPICPLHGGHPLDPVLEAEIAVWACPRGEVVARIGSLDQSARSAAP